MGQQEFQDSQKLLNERGLPTNFGWARSPLWAYDRRLILVRKHRIVESERYVLLAEDKIVLIEVVQQGFISYVSVSVVDLILKKAWSDYFPFLFPLGMFSGSPTPSGNLYKIRDKRLLLDINVLENGNRVIKIDIPRFNHGKGLRGMVVMIRPPFPEALATVSPWRKKPHCFRYSYAAPWYALEGVIRHGEEDLVFYKDHSWAVLLWDRGLNPAHDIHYWSCAAGITKGSQVSLSLGYGLMNAEYGTENAFFINGSLQKIQQVTFKISPKSWMEPWILTSDDQRLTLRFTPVAETRLTRKRIFQSIRQTTFFGFFQGVYTSENNEVFELNKIPGVAWREKVRL
ncbi:MAG TPA: DUF2804 domain-containing protein [Termitinemataceae bacterium]|jgi:hypothetical protein|uniref:DUF2804 domain-containing protein n=1 Tax=Treponema sp. J25 TaxID=2094121 RepID=UPI00104F4A8C|nr:DUF2804 domain-containing protein [Treponema sp. J25]TCW62322.1 hypothetical protein C5O22_02310 [Treponema sp. J25]HOJ99367.1 DUF2804 domain-containing protein [Termitinemataceae bacterium]HOM22492.1 DUF2804 domain-containing protein [Termitinemataceae bacterium]HPQ00737.1 DUF2804 domain-containing protein [Termitinemataceae bacterium]